MRTLPVLSLLIAAACADRSGKAPPDYGAARVAPPSSSALLLVHETLTSPAAAHDDSLGLGLSAGGHVDGDGYGELLVGLTGYEGCDGGGAARLYFGSADGAETTRTGDATSIRWV